MHYRYDIVIAKCKSQLQFMCTYLVSSPIIIVYKIQGEQGVILSMKKKQNIKKLSRRLQSQMLIQYRSYSHWIEGDQVIQ